MKKLILGLLVSLSFSQAFAKEIVIVSDLDETLRRADVEHHVKAGVRLLGGVKPYKGLTAIFKDLKESNGNIKFYYLSNSFPFLYNGKGWTKKNDLPEGVVYQRSLKDKSDSFKPRKLKEIKEKHPDAEFLFFGDNVEHDPKFYQEFAESSDLSNYSIYIRDALLKFPDSNKITYFQTDKQLISHFSLNQSTEDYLNSLSLKDLVPNFLFNNLKLRIIKECKRSKESECRKKAKEGTKEVKERLLVVLN